MYRKQLLVHFGHWPMSIGWMIGWHASSLVSDYTSIRREKDKQFCEFSIYVFFFFSSTLYIYWLYFRIHWIVLLVNSIHTLMAMAIRIRFLHSFSLHRITKLRKEILMKYLNVIILSIFLCETFSIVNDSVSKWYIFLYNQITFIYV